jgi:rare lipoprotein A
MTGSDPICDTSWTCPTTLRTSPHSIRASQHARCGRRSIPRRNPGVHTNWNGSVGTCISTLTFCRYSRRVLARQGFWNVRSCIAVLLLCLFNGPTRAEDCIASVYSIGDRSQRGTRTASGIPLDNKAMTAAHRTLKFGSKVRVTNKSNGRSATVTITDRGPYVRGRCIDLTKAAALSLGFAGLATVNVSPVITD